MHPAAPFNGTVPPTPSLNGAEYTLHGAAERLGCSLNTLRRRIKAGEIRAERLARPQGHTWRVFLPLNSASTVQHRAERGTVQSAPFNGTVQRDDEPSLTPLVELVRDLTERLHQQDVDHATELVRQAEAAAMWQARAEMLAGQLQQRDEQLKVLSAPRNTPAEQDAVISPGEIAPAGDAPHAPEPGILRRAWRWLAGAAGA